MIDTCLYNLNRGKLRALPSLW